MEATSFEAILQEIGEGIIRHIVEGPPRCEIGELSNRPNILNCSKLLKRS